MYTIRLVCLSVSLSVRLSVSLSICPCVFLSGLTYISLMHSHMHMVEHGTTLLAHDAQLV